MTHEVTKAFWDAAHIMSWGCPSGRKSKTRSAVHGAAHQGLCPWAEPAGGAVMVGAESPRGSSSRSSAGELLVLPQ